jgi:hypothetical protein
MSVLLTTSMHARLLDSEPGPVTLVTEFDGDAQPSVEFQGEVNGVPATKLEIAKGENKTFGFTHKDTSGNIITLVGATVHFAVRTTAKATTALITKSSATPSEITIDDAANGHANIFLVPGDTSALDVEDYVYDIWVVDSSALRNQAVEATRFRVNDRVVIIP